MSTLFVGNLHCESLWSPLMGGRRSAIPLSARRTISALATLLRAFLDEGDRIWTPAPVSPDRVPAVPGLPRPRLVAGRPLRIAPGERLLAWGETPDVAALRGEVDGADAVAARVNHRAFGLAVASARGRARPGAAILHSLHGLDVHLDECEQAGVPIARWVVKPPLSAAGRGRIFGSGARPDPGVERRIANLLNDHDSFLFEPWLERTVDYGTVGRIDETGVSELACHRQEVSPEGRWRGIELGDPGPDRDELLAVGRECGEALGAAGYRGPFGVDAFRYRDAAGAERLHGLCEINARLTFGHVARAILARVREPLGIPDGARVWLRTGRSGEEAGTVVPLLAAGTDDETAARLVYGLQPPSE